MNKNILWDCHMHSSFSADSSTPMEDMIKKAISIGLEGICFTEHLDPDYPETPDHLIFDLDLAAYQDKLFYFKELYKDQIDISYGLEFGLQPHLVPYLKQLISENTFDFIIGSSHIVHGYDPYYPQFFKNRSDDICYREYFESILENLSLFHNYIDTYGHLDYIVRYGSTKNTYYSYEKYSELLDEILKLLVKQRVALEINTGGYHYGLGEPNPCTDIIKRYKELGGELITIGADAHTPEKIGFAFDKAASLLYSCGFSDYTIFKNRAPISKKCVF